MAATTDDRAAPEFDDSGAVDATEPLRVLFRDLRSSAQGLSPREAARRLTVFGPNELRRTVRRHAWRELVDQLIHPLALLLWAAAALAWLASAPVLTVAIVVVIWLNAIFAFVQERQGEQAVEALGRYLPQLATVLRDGVRLTIPASDLVPGDVILIDEGDRVCADARLIDGAVEVDSSTLTGEALPVLRSATATDTSASLLESPTLVFSGTSCTGGSATAMVVRTGMSSELGRIAALSQRVSREPSPLELQVRKVAWLIAVVAIIAALAFIPLGAWVAGLSLPDAITFAIGLIVANVPEGLLPTITLALAVAVRELARRGALVKRLSAVETLGSTSVICTDKTGTLTLNRMRAMLAWTATGELPLAEAHPAPRDHVDSELARALARCNTAELDGDDHGLGRGDPTDLALLDAARRLGADPAASVRDAGRRAMFHFDPQLRLMSTVDQDDNGLVLSTKGAPEEVLARSDALLTDAGRQPLDAQRRRQLDEVVTTYAERGLRLLAVATRRLETVPGTEARAATERELTLLGLVALHDPARPEVARAVESCHTAGIRILVLTGDHRLTAGAIAEQVGIGHGHAFTVNANTLEGLTDAEFDTFLSGDREIVLARSSPEMKLRVTEALQDDGQVVAMTGDGVNDAPALRRADIGVAMGAKGTDVAREASTMVLTDDDFGTIVTAVEGGRRVYDNVRKFILYIFAHATPEVIPFLLFALSGGRIPLPITVLQILAIDIGTETLPALALGREPAEVGLMDRPPRPPTEQLIRPSLLVRAWALLGGVSAVLVLLGFFWVLRDGGWTPGADVSAGSPLHHTYLAATTMTFLGIVACQVGTAFAARTERASLWSIGVFSNRLLLWGIAFELVFAAAIVALPRVSAALGMAVPPLQMLAVLPLFAVIVWGVDEVVRAIRRHTRQRSVTGLPQPTSTR